MQLKCREVWRNVPKTVCYVSNLGRVKTVKNGNEHFVKPYNNKNGYLTFNLYIEGRQKTASIHILVAKLFLGERPNGYVINHKDGNKHNNRISNLEYVTYQENSIHAFENGLNLSGEEHPNAKLTDSQIVEIRLKSCAGYSDLELSTKYGVHRKTINRIVNMKSRKQENVIYPLPVNSLGDKTMKTTLIKFDDCPEGRTPIVVFHQFNTSEDYVCLSLEDFFKLVEVDKIVGKRKFK